MSKFWHVVLHLVIGAANGILVAHYTQGSPWPAAIAAGSTYAVGAAVALYNHSNGK